MLRMYIALAATVALAGCATVSKPLAVTEAPASRTEQVQAQETVAQPEVPVLKRRIAIARFSNETRYGRTFQTDANRDPLGKQTSDMLASRLIDTKRFLVFERSDLNQVLAEQKISGDAGLIGVDTIIVGSLTEFGRSTEGKAGFLSATKVQIARAKVEARLVDVRTGHVFFSVTGSGNASTESGQIAGWGSKADYDGTLNDQAIGAAISDMIGRLIAKMEERPWRTAILKASGRQVLIAGGARQGLKAGDQLVVYQTGEKVKNDQTGFMIDLPPSTVGALRVVDFFGDTETNEGAICELVSGAIPPGAKGVFVAQAKR